ncbi:MAG: universal stress protein [Thermodesulfobacteriota bacterium]
MIKKIVWASDGSKDSVDALTFAENIARALDSEIIGLYVIPDYFEVKALDEFPTRELDLLADWIKEKESKGSDRLNSISEDLKLKGLHFKTRITQGVPYLKIIEAGEEENADLIVLGKGRAEERNILGATALKVLRRSRIPVLIVRKGSTIHGIKRILVPTDLYNIMSRDLQLALGLAKDLGAEIYSINIVATSEGKYPPKLIELMRGDAYNKLTEQVEEAKLEDRVETAVETARNPWLGIVNYAKEKNIDLIIMNTYGGYKFRREDFIGSVAERVVQEAPCPVITVKPL